MNSSNKEKNMSLYAWHIVAYEGLYIWPILYYILFAEILKLWIEAAISNLIMILKNVYVDFFKRVVAYKRGYGMI